MTGKKNDYKTSLIIVLQQGNNTNHFFMTNKINKILLNYIFHFWSFFVQLKITRYILHVNQSTKYMKEAKSRALDKNIELENKTDYSILEIQFYTIEQDYKKSILLNRKMKYAAIKNNIN